MKSYIPKKYKNPTKAIREKCIECMGGRENEGYLKLISDCGSPDCALFEFRFGKNPYNRKNLSDNRRTELAIHARKVLGDCKIQGKVN